MSMILGCRQFCKLYDCIYSATKPASFSRSKYTLPRDMSKSWQRQAIDWIWRHPITDRHKKHCKTPKTHLAFKEWRK
jgi:hypothetical protein